MRPSDAHGRPRSADNDDPHSFHAAPSGPQMTYFLADEARVDAALEQSPFAASRVRDGRKPQLTIRPEPACPSSGSAALDKPATTEHASDVDESAIDDGSPEATPSYKSYDTPMSYAQPSLS